MTKQQEQKALKEIYLKNENNDLSDLEIMEMFGSFCITLNASKIAQDGKADNELPNLPRGFGQ